MKEVIENLIKDALSSFQIEVGDIVVEHPGDLAHGDYATSAPMMYTKQAGMSPKELAEKMVEALRQAQGDFIYEIKIAGPGFINFYLSKEFFRESLKEIIIKGDEYGKNESLKGEKVIVEHTDPNPFKEFHIGHLMPNIVGSTVANIFRWNGAEVKEVNYQGDIGMHVAKAVWGMTQEAEDPYVFGNKKFDENEDVKKEITEINKKLYLRSDQILNELYDKGRKQSLEYFESIYKKFGTKFDHYFFESETASIGKELVEKNVGKVFEKSDGATIFSAEKYDESLHTRVFINSEGLPTYEAKELGLAKIKFDYYPYTTSIVVTGNEIRDYFRVLLAAMKLVLPELEQKTKHLPHGMLRLATGKMSSRTGDVITAIELVEKTKEAITEQGNAATEDIAIGAIKYMILRQAIGGDIVFDFGKSVSTEGDSGPYLQYAHARTNSLLEKAGKKGSLEGERKELHEIEKILYRFPGVVERAMKEYAPHYILTYLTELSGSFNNFYANEQIISDDAESEYRIAITEAFNIVLKNGLTILGIPTPERM